MLNYLLDRLLAALVVLFLLLLLVAARNTARQFQEVHRIHTECSPTGNTRERVVCHPPRYDVYAPRARYTELLTEVEYLCPDNSRPWL
jgi:hypothetical protein